MGNEGLHELAHVAHGADGVDDRRHQRLTPGEHQQLPRELRAGVDGARHGCERRLQRRRALEAPAQQVKVVVEHHQQVVEVVRNAAGEQAQRLELLRMPQRRFGAAAVLGFLAQLAVGLLLAFGASQSEHQQPDQRRSRGEGDGGQRADRGIPGPQQDPRLERGGEVQRMIIHAGESEQALAARRWVRARCEKPTVSPLAKRSSTAVRRREADVVRGWPWPAREERALLAQECEREAGLALGEAPVVVDEVIGAQRNRDHAGEGAVVLPAVRDVEERLAGRAAAQRGAHVPLQLTALVRLEVLAVAHVEPRGHGIEQAARDRHAFGVPDPDRLHLRQALARGAGRARAAGARAALPFRCRRGQAHSAASGRSPR